MRASFNDSMISFRAPLPEPWRVRVQKRCERSVKYVEAFDAAVRERFQPPLSPMTDAPSVPLVVSTAIATEQPCLRPRKQSAGHDYVGEEDLIELGLARHLRGVYSKGNACRGGRTRCPYGARVGVGRARRSPVAVAPPGPHLLP